MASTAKHAKVLYDAAAAQPLLTLDANCGQYSYRYWPRFDSVSIARDALDDLPVTSVRM